MPKGCYMAVDQHGHTEHDLTYPRRDLMERMGCKSAEEMYVDGVDGKTYHVGYVVGHHWFSVYKVERMMILEEEEGGTS